MKITPTVSPAPADWRRWVAFDHCRVLLPHFAFARRTDALSRLHRLALDEAAPPEPRTAGRWYARVIFATVALRQVWIFFRRYGSYARTRDGVSRSRQLRDLWHCVWHHNNYARHYYWRKLYLEPRRTRWLDNLEHRQLTTLLRHLNRHLPIEQVTDKIHFHEHCQRHGLPTPRVIAAWSDTGALLAATPAPLAADLFLKPAAEYGSRGIQALSWDPVTHTHRLDGRDFAWPELLAELAAQARTEKRRLVLQPRLRNARRNAVYGNFDLCNLRIVTAIDPASGEPEALGSFVRLPSQFTRGGYDRHILFAPVDLANGRMGTGRLREITQGDFHRHPETSAPISGRLIPGWDEMLALALTAHRSMPWLPFVGWDIVDTDKGVMLLEANAFWGGDALQPPGGLALGRTRFPELYLAWHARLHAGEPAPQAAAFATP
jgi:hypothetical protein